MMIETDISDLAGLLRCTDADLGDIAAKLGRLSPPQSCIISAQACVRAAAIALDDALKNLNAAQPTIVLELVDDDAAAALISQLPPTVLAISPGAVRLRLSAPNTLVGCSYAAGVMSRLGWRQNASGYWHRPGYGAAATPAGPAT